MLGALLLSSLTFQGSEKGCRAKKKQNQRFVRSHGGQVPIAMPVGPDVRTRVRLALAILLRNCSAVQFRLRGQLRKCAGVKLADFQSLPLAFPMILCFDKQRDAKKNASAPGILTQNGGVVHRADGVPVGIEAAW